MAGIPTGGQRRVTLTPRERRRYVRWWLEESGLRQDELIRIAMGLRPEREVTRPRARRAYSLK